MKMKNEILRRANWYWNSIFYLMAYIIYKNVINVDTYESLLVNDLLIDLKKM